MNDKFKPIDADFSDEDIISVNDKLFEIKQFKEEAKNGLHHKKLYIHPYLEGLTDLLGKKLFNWLGVIEVGQTIIPASNLNWESKIIDGKILRLGSKNWQKVKLKLQIVCENTGGYFSVQEIFIEYCLDEPEVPESPLDEMRKAFEQNI